jgi:hypothetical protein
MKIIKTLLGACNHIFRPALCDPLLSEEDTLYAKKSYPRNHTYKICVRTKQLFPQLRLASRYKKIKSLYPKPITSLLDIGCSKGFFVFAASIGPDCKKSLGIDIDEHDIQFCNRIKKYLGNANAYFELMQLHELADNIDQYGGPYQTVLLCNIYQYLYFGSGRSVKCYLSHEDIFRHLSKICCGRVIFNNRVHLRDCQNVEFVQKAGARAEEYSWEKMIDAASRYFNISEHGKIGKYPLLAFDRKDHV